MIKNLILRLGRISNDVQIARILSADINNSWTIMLLKRKEIAHTKVLEAEISPTKIISNNMLKLN